MVILSAMAIAKVMLLDEFPLASLIPREGWIEGRKDRGKEGRDFRE